MNAYVKEYLLMLVAEPFKCGRKEAKIYILSDRGWTDGQEGPPWVKSVQIALCCKYFFVHSRMGGTLNT